MKRGLATLLGLAAAACSSSDAAPEGRPLIVLAVDGMDPGLLRRFMAEGRTPNLARIAKQGTFQNLATSNPPQSPVAWSHFITGTEASQHGIYDFLHRDTETMAPYLSTSKAEGPAFTVPLGHHHLPLFGGGVELLRAGDPFWSGLEARGVKSTVIKIPANYPPREPSGARVLSGMGTPDLLGTPGTYSVYTTDPTMVTKEVSGGRLELLDFDLERRAHATLVGPPDPLRVDGRPLTAEIELVVEDVDETALLRIGDEERLIAIGEWSDWMPVSLEGEIPGFSADGMVRAYLRSVGARLTLYLSPVNLDPLSPAQPISSPEDFAPALAKRVGRFFTQGMPEETKALAAGLLTDEEFLAQSALVLEERRRMLAAALDDLQDGFLFFYFSSVDLTSHMFYRTLDPEASPEDAKYADVIPNLYAEIDQIVGEVRAERPDAVLIVMSDHGFGPYDWQVDVNAWLYERGYLALAEAPAPGPLGHIDWSRTRAYGLGLNQLFVNLAGREPEGIVKPQDRLPLLERIRSELEALRNPHNGERVVSRAFLTPPSAFPEHAPDMIVGYNLGYRSSDASALGEVRSTVVRPNESKWSGDHCIDPAYVPGVLLSTVGLPEGDWALTDLSRLVEAHFEDQP